MSYRYHPRGYYRRHRHWRPRRRSSAGAWLIGLFIVMAIMGLGRAPELPRSPGLTAPDLPSRQQPRASALAPTAENSGNDPVQGPAALVDAPPPADDSSPGDDDEPVEPAAAAPVPAGCASRVCRRAYASYSELAGAKAFALADDGRGFWDTDEASVSEAIRRALDRCASHGGSGCRVAHLSGGEP